MSLDLIKKIKAITADRPTYVPWNIKDITILYAVPPVPVRGLEYVFARHNFPQTLRVGSLNGNSVFVSNQNKSGIIEFACLNGTFTGAGVQIAELTGIPFPIAVTDKATGGSATVAGAACRRVGTPEWRRGKFPNLDIFTFEVDKLIISTGLRDVA